MTTTGPAPGLRRQLTFEEAAQLAEVHGPEIHFDYAALRLTQSPLFQRLGERMEDDIGAQNAARMAEVERQHNVTRIAAESGVTRADLEEVLKQVARTQPDPPPPPVDVQPPPPPPPPPTGGVDPPVDPAPPTGGTPPVDVPDPKREAERLHLMGEIARISAEQEKMKQQAKIAQEVTARISTSNARDPRQEIIRELWHHTVHPIAVPVPVPNQNLQDNGALLELLRNALANQNHNISRVADQLGMTHAQILEMLKGTARPQEVNVAPPPKPTIHNMATLGRDRTRSPPGDEGTSSGQGPQAYEPTPQLTKSTYGPMGRRPLRADPYEPTPQVVRPKPLPSGTPAPETPQVARPRPRPSRAPEPETPQLVRAPSAPARAASVPETPVLARGSSVETVRYPSRSRSRALSETPQMAASDRGPGPLQPPRRAMLPIADEPETPQLARGRSQGERVLALVPEETPQLPEKLRKRFEKQRQRAQRQGQMREGLNKFLEQQRVSIAAQQAEANITRFALDAGLKKRSIAEQMQAIERSGHRAADELSPRVRKQPPPIGTFMSRQKTIGGEVRRYKLAGPT